MILIGVIMRDGVHSFYEVDTIESDRYEPNDSLHLIFRGLIHVGRKGVKRDEIGTDIVPMKDIVSLTLYGATQYFDGTMKVSSPELSNMLTMLLCKVGVDCMIAVGTAEQGNKHLRELL